MLGSDWLGDGSAEKDLEVLVDSKLSMSQQYALQQKGKQCPGLASARVWTVDQGTWLFHCTWHFQSHTWEYCVWFWSPSLRNWKTVEATVEACESD